LSAQEAGTLTRATARPLVHLGQDLRLAEELLWAPLTGVGLGLDVGTNSDAFADWSLDDVC